MTQDEIIFMARASGWMSEYESSTGFSAEAAIKFAKLVAQHEREGCIKACEQVTADLKNYASAFEGITAETKFIRNIGGVVGEPFIDAIRARGQE
jgi:hypothetical protein